MILKKIIDYYQNQIENIRKMPNGQIKRNAIGALVADIGGNCISAVAKELGSCWRYVKKCYEEYLEPPPAKTENRGRKSIQESHPDIEEDIEKIIREDACCDPGFKHEWRYVRLTAKEIANRLVASGKYTEENCPSETIIKKLLKKLKIKLKKVQKTKPIKKIAETDAIFENVKERKEACMGDGNCVLISIDTKDRVAIGDFSRGGYSYNEVKALDHDFKSEFVTPFGILDLKTDTPHFYNVESKVTAECMVDSIEDFLLTNYIYKEALFNKLAITSDNGPENSSSRTYFIYALIMLAIKYNIEIELIYYPPYHSKYNPIERIWARLENIWNGSLLSSLKVVCNFMKNLTWKNIKATVKSVTKEYKTGLKIKKKDLDQLKAKHVTYTKGIEKWSLIIRP